MVGLSRAGTCDLIVDYAPDTGCSKEICFRIYFAVGNLSVMQSRLMQYNKQLLQVFIYEILMLKSLRSSDLSRFLMRTFISQ